MKEQLKQLLKDVIIYSLGRNAALLISIVMVPIYTRIFTPSDYGVIDVVTTTMFFIMPLVSLELDTASVRYYFDSEQKTHRQQVVSSSLYFVLAFSAVICAISVLASKQISLLIFKSESYSTILTLAFVDILAVVCFKHTSNVLRVSFRSFWYSLVNVAAVVLTASLTIYFVVFRKVGIKGVFLGSMISNIILATVSFMASLDLYRLSFSWKLVKRLLLYGIPIVPLRIFLWVVRYCNRYFLLAFASLHEVGLYSAGVKVSSLLALIMFGFQRAWTPFVYSNLNREDAPVFFAKICNYYMVFLSFGMVFLSVFAKEILAFVTQPTYVPGYKAVGFLCLGLVMLNFRGFFEIGINVAKKTYLTTIAVSIAAVTNIVLNFFLVPLYGIIGAALGTLISYTISAVLTYMMSKKYYTVQYQFEKLFKVLATSALLVAVGTVINTGSMISTIGLKSVCVSAYFPALIFFHVIGAQELGYLKRTLQRRWIYIIQICHSRRQAVEN